MRARRSWLIMQMIFVLPVNIKNIVRIEWWKRKKTLDL